VKRLLLLIVVVGLGGLLIAIPRSSVPSADPSRLTWVATARQHGPVGYRDPVGAISPDGRSIAYSEGRFVRVRPLDGGPDVELPPGDMQIRRLAWSADGETIVTDGAPGARARYQVALRVREPFTERPQIDEPACIEVRGDRPRITIPCKGVALDLDASLVPYGPLAISPDRGTVYFAAPNAGGTVDLWSIAASGGQAKRLTSFSRDTYAPTVAADGTVLFKVQSYRTVVARVSADGGHATPLATFQSETPSWHPRGDRLGITYGTWRRVIDDAKYPDIAQDAGIIQLVADTPAARVTEVVDNSNSEDQSLCWSPNGRWIAYHSHKDQSDDVWLRPADGSAPGRRVSFLGRGAETGWPRWSADGRWVLFEGSPKPGANAALYAIGVDQESGRVTQEPQAVPVKGLDADIGHAEWLGRSSDAIIGIAKEGPGKHAIFTLTRATGEARVIRRFATEHDNPGLGVSPDGQHAAFVAPAADGYFQIFRMPVKGGEAIQITRDGSNKTQPAWSPDGKTIAFTVWSYEAQFWTINPTAAQ
jgi:Tol biopolymer transport system component